MTIYIGFQENDHNLLKMNKSYGSSSLLEVMDVNKAMLKNFVMEACYFVWFV